MACDEKGRTMLDECMLLQVACTASASIPPRDSTLPPSLPPLLPTSPFMTVCCCARRRM